MMAMLHRAIDADDEVINMMGRRLARGSWMYRTARLSLQHPRTQNGRALRATVRESAKTGFTEWIHGSWLEG